jgi:hypothetical protein
MIFWTIKLFRIISKSMEMHLVVISFNHLSKENLSKIQTFSSSNQISCLRLHLTPERLTLTIEN